MKRVQQEELVYSGGNAQRPYDQAFLSICASVHGSLQSKQRDATSRGFAPGQLCRDGLLRCLDLTSGAVCFLPRGLRRRGGEGNCPASLSRLSVLSFAFPPSALNCVSG